MKITKILVILSIFGILFCQTNTANSILFAQEQSLVVNYMLDFGKTYFKQQEYIESQREFEKCLIVDPKNKIAKQYLAKISEKLKQNTQLTNKQAQEFAKQVSKTISKRQAAIEQAFETSQNKDQPIDKEPNVSQEDNLPPGEEKKIEAEKKFETWVGGAWTLPKNLLYLETFMQYYWHNQQFNNERKKVYWNGGGKDIERNVELKIHYGITDNLTYMADISHKSLLWKDIWQRNRTKGIASVWTGVKYNLIEEPLYLTPQFRMKIPTNYNPNKTPSLGNNQWDYEFMILTAKNFRPWPFYAKFDTGYRLRSGSTSCDVIPYFFEAGYIPIDWLLLKSTIDGVNGIGGTGDTQEDYTKYTVAALFNFFRQIKFEFGYGRTFAGKNTSAADEWYFKTIALF